ncbi:MAG: hypothetical protein ACI8PZ_000910 [Myxococcota bacterium]|jgi:hypothetical protein
MQGFFDILVSFPTIVFSVSLGLVLLYWVTVMLGAADIDLMDGVLDGAGEGLEGAMDGAIDGALDGAMDGAVDGAADAIDGAVEADTDLDADMDGSAESFSALKFIANALRLGRVPATITLSLFVFGGWFTSFLLTWTALQASVALHGAVLGALIFLTASLLATAFTNVATRPVEPVFKVAHARERNSLVGEACEITTGRVDGRFGQAIAMVGGDDLLFQVRCDTADNTLRKGQRALIVSFDRKREAFVIEPLTAPLGAPARAGQSLAAQAATTRNKSLSEE